MKKIQRKTILVIALAINIIVLLALVFFFLRDNGAMSSKVECNDSIWPWDCPNEEQGESDEINLPVSKETSQPDGTYRVIVNPELDASYLVNPGIGWQHDTNKSSEFLPETVSYANRKEIGWSVLNPGDGLYDWSVLDGQLMLATAASKLYSFRIYTMAGESFGGHQVPAWVLEKGAKILPSGEPDYSNCIYQEEWGRFVQELIDRYDGNPDIAFIDISGYGNFSEWSWRDEQTRWDDLWEENYRNGTANTFTIYTLDGQARRRLVDMFIGGLFERHQCRDSDGVIQTIDYSYPGFTSTQLVMPYAGIVQSTQYVFSRRTDVGFRYDSLGRSSNLDVDKVVDEISQIWKSAPVIFEFSKPEEFDYDTASQMLQSAHASLVHNNDYEQSKEKLQSLIAKVGYRYFLKEAQIEVQPFAGGKIDLDMSWQNTGLAPSYPKMGQKFTLHFLLVDTNDQVVLDYPFQEDLSSWLPTSLPNSLSPTYEVNAVLFFPNDLPAGDYKALVSITDERTNEPIRLAISQEGKSGRYLLKVITIK